jgi:transcription antitermination factor NusG
MSEGVPSLKADAKAWFALRVKTRAEAVPAGILGGKGYECWLPRYTVRSRWSDRVKQLEKPVFPGYLFARFDPQDRLPVLTTPGVMSVVSFGRGPEPVNELELASLRTALNTELPMQPWPFLQAGDRVRICEGALAGLEGVLVSCRTSCRIVLTLSLLQRAVAVEIDRSWVSPVEANCRNNWPALTAAAY